MRLPAGLKRIDWVRNRAVAGLPPIAVRRLGRRVLYFRYIRVEGLVFMDAIGTECWLVTRAPIKGTQRAKDSVSA